MTESNSNLEVNKNIGDKDWILNGIHAFCKRHSKWTGYGGAFLVGSFINIWSDSTVKYGLQLLNRMFNVNERPINILSWIALSFVILLPVGRLLTERYAHSRTYAKRLAALYRNQIDKLLQPFSEGRIGWGLGLTLQSCPDLQEGWSTKEVAIEYRPIEYIFPQEINNAYQQYLATEFPQMYTEDKTRLMLVETPVAFSDMFPLRLTVQKTKWSQFQFYHKWISENQSRQKHDINLVINNRNIHFPNSLCLHLVVRTNDHKFLLAETGRKKGGDYPAVWALSIGEQLDLYLDIKKDLESGDDIVLNWARRALMEELGISKDDFAAKNVRVMAVNLEGDINNFAIVTIVALNYDSNELKAKLENPLRIDSCEIEKCEFIHRDDIPKELVNATRDYHPSTGIRMFYAGLYEFGAPGLNRRLLNQITK
jgi:hypothetical protein